MGNCDPAARSPAESRLLQLRAVLGGVCRRVVALPSGEFVVAVLAIPGGRAHGINRGLCGLG